MIPMLFNKKLNLIVTELFVRGRKLNISHYFFTQSYFAVPKNIRLISGDYSIMTIPNEQELPKISFNNLSDIDFKDFMNLYKKNIAKSYSLLVIDTADFKDFMNLCKKNPAKPYSFLVIDTTLTSDNPLCLRKNILERI